MKSGPQMVVIHPSRFLPTRILCLVIMLTSINLASNYAMIGIPNIKFMDLIVFLSGYLIGLVPGILVGVLTWLVYGTLNPLGFNLIILVATCLSETIYAILGWLSRRLNLGLNALALVETNKENFWLTNLKFGIVGFFATIIYDLITNIASVVIVGLPPIMAIISGAWFAIVHEVSNFVFFFFGCIPLIAVLRKIIPKKEVMEL
ncbi:MAG: hypothetical protein QXH24_06660 [Candidatus Bathyarchaeia archaeon]